MHTFEGAVSTQSTNKDSECLEEDKCDFICLGGHYPFSLLQSKEKPEAEPGTPPPGQLAGHSGTPSRTYVLSLCHLLMCRHALNKGRRSQIQHDPHASDLFAAVHL
ncbi:TPA: hypothetical protein ACH3X1_000114 [Trebouxia sp. C0004]